MATDADYMEFVADQLSGVGRIRCRKMFGEYALYCDDKVVAFLCDNAFFLKPTGAGRALLPTPVEGHPYPGSKPWLLLEAEVEDREALGALVRATADALPLPAPKKPKGATAPKAAPRKANKGRGG